MRARYIGLPGSLRRIIALASVPVAQAKEAPPETTPEGLVLLKSTKSRISYVKPGATFTQYNRVAILDPLVDFEKDWQKDYNSSRTGALSGRVSDSGHRAHESGTRRRVQESVYQGTAGQRWLPGGHHGSPRCARAATGLLNVEVNAPDLMEPRESMRPSCARPDR